MKSLSVLLLSIVFVWCFSTISNAKTTFVTIGTGGLTGVYYPTGGAIAKIINKQRKKLGIRCSVESTDGSVFNVNAVVTRQLDFGIVQSDRQYQAVKGIADWQKKGPQKSLRSVFSIYPETCSLVAAVDANIKTPFDLKGKKVNLGNNGSGHLGNSMDLLKSIGFNPDFDLEAYYIDPVSAPGLLQDGKLDAFFYTVGHPSRALKEATSGARKVKFVPIENNEMIYFVKSLPYYSQATIPVKYYPGAENSSDIPTFGVCATLVTSSEVSSDIVYAIARTMMENLDEFKQQHPAYELIKKEDMLECLSAPLHPGALKYYKEIGLK